MQFNLFVSKQELSYRIFTVLTQSIKEKFSKTWNISFCDKFLIIVTKKEHLGPKLTLLQIPTIFYQSQKTLPNHVNLWQDNKP
jgi:hypothetical protein